MPTLVWNTRETDLQIADNTPYLTLSGQGVFGNPDNHNLLVQGDNLATLKALMPHYAAAVKCVFIDPPYNTGHAFAQYQDSLEHSEWLRLIYPRLSLLRDMLSDDGSIWVTIDDDESHYLKVIMDEIFGRKNFVANVVWQKKFSPQNDAKWLSDSHDHILVYAKNKSIWRPNLLPRSDEAESRYKNPDNDPRGAWISSDLTAQQPFEYGQYPITGPTGKSFLPGNNRHWLYHKEKTLQLVKENRIWFGASGNNKPRLKIFLSEAKTGVTPTTFWTHKEVGHNQDAKKEVKPFNLDDVFSTPKPEKLIQRILHLATQPNDLVLDSFLGSGTSAAVAHKMKRRYIGIEMGEHAKTHCIPRLQKVIEGEPHGISESVDWQGGGGFHFAVLGKPVFDHRGHINRTIQYEALSAHLWFSQTHRPLNQQTANPPFLGVHNGEGIALLYNGILGDKKPNGGNVLNNATLSIIRKNTAKNFNGKLIVYGHGCQFRSPRLLHENLEFRQIPYDFTEEK